MELNHHYHGLRERDRKRKKERTTVGETEGVWGELKEKKCLGLIFESSSDIKGKKESVRRESASACMCMCQSSVIWVVKTYPNNSFDQTSSFFFSLFPQKHLKWMTGAKGRVRSEGGMEREN